MEPTCLLLFVCFLRWCKMGMLIEGRTNKWLELEILTANITDVCISKCLVHHVIIIILFSYFEIHWTAMDISSLVQWSMRMQTKLTTLFPGPENCCKQCLSLCNIQNNGFSTGSRSDALEPELIPALISTVWRHTANPRRLSCRHWWMVIGWKPLSAAWLQCSVQHHKRIIRIQHINPASCPDLLFYDTEMQ